MVEKVTLPTTWAQADAEVARKFDAPEEKKEEEVVNEVKGQGLVEILHLLVAQGMSAADAGKAAQKWGSQLTEMQGMGFQVTPQAAALCEKYHGRLVRVVNALADEPVAMSDTSEEQPVPSVEEEMPQVEEEVARPPITHVPLPVAMAGYPEPAPVPMPTDAPAVEVTPSAQVDAQPQGMLGEDKWPGVLVDLTAMGFLDEARNRVLLAKYAGRVDRVITALCE